VPVAEPVTPLEPWQTAWPAGVALVGLLVAMWKARAHLRPERGALPWLSGLVGVALLVRLVVVPALDAHYYDGHEAEYWDIFRGVREVNRGGTVLYPAMQWLWWGLGTVLPHHRVVPIVVMAILGALGCALGALAVQRWTTRTGGALAGLVLALHPILAAWSSSAYNVVVPWFFASVVVWSASVLARSRRPPLSVVWVAGFAWALVAATRLEATWIAAPALLVALFDRAPDQPLGRRLRACWTWALPVGIGALVGGAAIVPLVFPGEVPGAGERALSFLINRTWMAPYAPLDSLFGVVAVLVLAVLVVLQRHLAGGVFLVASVGAHLVLASFDDFGDRHTLNSLFALALAVGVAGSADRWMRWPGRGAAGLVVVLCLLGLADLRPRFYGSEEAFASVLHTNPRWAELPRWTPVQARSDCGWIAEDPRVAPQPQKSHFNLIDPHEAEQLRQANNCLRWCVDVQDWRWSSRGVRDRALRTARLYRMTPVAVVEDAGSGYACLVMELGARRCCPTASTPPTGDVGPRPAPPRAPSNVEDDASGSFQHSPIP